MRCPACGVLVHDADDYCRRCGSRVEFDTTKSTRGSLRSQVGRQDEPEEILWQGGYAIKAMFREFGAAVVACVAIVILTGAAVDPEISSLRWPGIGLVVGAILLVVAYRKLDVAYRVSNQRLFHEDGILYRRLNRIEIIDIDDLRCEQGLIERVLGVGRILVSSSDDTHPVLEMEGIDRVREVYELIDQARRRERMRHGLHVEAI